MTKIDLLPQEKATEKTLSLYQALESKVGRVPNVYQVYAHSDAVLEANLSMDGALSNGFLKGKEIEIVALVVSEFNGCEYCLCAHTALGKMFGMSDEQTILARQGTSDSENLKTLAEFTLAILEKRGKVSKADLNSFYEAGYGAGHVVEVIGQVAKNFFNNYTNHIAGTPVDFPSVASLDEVNV